ncbi:MAG: DnaB-like helicase N-terminal domain-containing protein, partial [bacterium]
MPSTAHDRVPPQNLEAERAALGSMLLGNEASREALAKVAGSLQIFDFYRTGHQRVYAAVRGLFERGEKVDLITVTEWLRKAGELEPAGGYAYVAGLVDEIPLAANIEEYAKIIKDKALMRRLMEVGSDLFGRASEDAITPDALSVVAEILGRRV